jgi:hypothetical protein
MLMFDPDYKRINLATWIVGQLPNSVDEAHAVLRLASEIVAPILNCPDAHQAKSDSETVSSSDKANCG